MAVKKNKASKHDQMIAPQSPAADFYDEAFIEYLHTFADEVHHEISKHEQSRDKKKENYFRGMYFALRAISRVYVGLSNGDLG